MTSTMCEECLVIYDKENKCLYCGRNTKKLNTEETNQAEYICKRWV